MKKHFGKLAALGLGCVTGILLGVFFEEGIDAALSRTTGLGGEILVLPLIFILVYVGYYLSKEFYREQGNDETDK